jgi:MoxR-like ATPase
MLAGADRRALAAALLPVVDEAGLRALQQQAASVHGSPALIDYVQSLLEFSRGAHQYTNGLSPRAGIALLRGARAWALLAGRDYLLPEDVQAVLPGVAGHRLRGRDGEEGDPARLLQPLLELAIP